VVIIICVSARARNSEVALVIQFGVLLCEGFMKLLYLTHIYSRSGRESWFEKGQQDKKTNKNVLLCVMFLLLRLEGH